MKKLTVLFLLSAGVVAALGIVLGRPTLVEGVPVGQQTARPAADFVTPQELPGPFDASRNPPSDEEITRGEKLWDKVTQRWFAVGSGAYVIFPYMVHVVSTEAQDFNIDILGNGPNPLRKQFTEAHTLNPHLMIVTSEFPSSTLKVICIPALIAPEYLKAHRPGLPPQAFGNIYVRVNDDAEPLREIRVVVTIAPHGSAAASEPVNADSLWQYYPALFRSLHNGGD